MMEITTGKKIILYTVFFLVEGLLALLLAVFAADDFRKIVRELMLFFHGDDITFYGKDFVLLPSGWSLVIFVGWVLALTMIGLRLSGRWILYAAFIPLLVFALTLAAIVFTEGVRLVVTCTTCGDNIRKVGVKELSYDLYLALSLLMSLLSAALVYWAGRKKMMASGR